MKLWSDSFTNGARIPEDFAFCAEAGWGGNRNPHFEWSSLPPATRSLVMICVDPDVPAKASDRADTSHPISESAARTDFYHWVMVDIKPAESAIVEGSCSSGVSVGGKTQPKGPPGTRQGINDYTSFTRGDQTLSGIYRGYDGPCPPAHDEKIHHYHFKLFATDFARCPVEGDFTAHDVLQAIEGHILDQDEWVGLYTLNLSVL